MISAATLAIPAATAGAATITVNDPGAVAADDGDCTLPEAIVAANDNSQSGATAGECAAGDAPPEIELIEFTITGGGPHLIQPTTALAPITEPVTIDGQSGDGDEIELDGSAAAGGADGLTLAAGSGGSTIREIAIHGFTDDAMADVVPPEGDAIRVESDGNTIEDVRLGADFADTPSIGNEGDGASIVGASNELMNSIISGNADTGVEIRGIGADFNAVAGNMIGTNSSGDAPLSNGLAGVAIAFGPEGTIVGGTQPGEGNLISGNLGSGVVIQRGDGTEVHGNLIGVDSDGDDALVNTQPAVTILDSDGVLVGDGTSAGRNVITSDSTPSVSLFAISEPEISSGGAILGNYVGLTADGTDVVGNPTTGISVGDWTADTVVGASGAGNVIAGTQSAVSLSASNSNQGTLVQGNRIGVPPEGVVAVGDLGNLFGVRMVGVASDATIGGITPGEGNVIRNTTTNAVEVFSDGNVDNSILGNSIADTGQLAIDLSIDNVVTPNDPDDVDTGPNDLQNFPVLRAAVAGTSTAISGDLDSTPSTTFRLEFFSNPEPGHMGHGEGEIFLGATEVTTDAGGDASFAVTVPGTPPGSSVTATATELGPGGEPGSTSEFSEAIVEGPCDFDGTAGDDSLTGTPAAEILCGGGGDDVLLGAGGDDLLLGGAGTDHASFAGAAPVTASLAAGTASGQGSDTLDSIEGLIGSEANDTLSGDDGATFIDGGGGNDLLRGLGGPDLLLGGGGFDRLIANQGRDRLFGGPRRDRLFGGNGPDLLNGQAGHDILNGGRHADRIFGRTGRDRLLGRHGFDRLFGGGARDLLLGGAGRDLLWGQGGPRDLCNGGPGRDRPRTRGCERVRRIP